MIYVCCDKERRNRIEKHPSLNGIDFLEVSDNPTDPPDQRQQQVSVHFIKPITPAHHLDAANFRIDGGERIRDVKVKKAAGGSGSPPTNVVVIDVDPVGDFSTYTLRVVANPASLDPPSGYDVMLSALDFSFKVACPSDFDCKQTESCPPEAPTRPDINYLAKDYASFRQLILDRLSALAPKWKERSAADIGIVLSEIVAYAGDYLSYQQDAVATEAYLHTSRRRISLRRHARLIDYAISEGCNARVWVHVPVDVPQVHLPAHTPILTRVHERPTRIPPIDFVTILDQTPTPEVFETVAGADFYQQNNVVDFHTWGDTKCCLPRNATRATLKNRAPGLKLAKGDVLVFVETRDPNTGNVDEANPAHRHAVRLTGVEKASDALLSEDVLNIWWAEEDALPFALCISTPGIAAPISVAHGNIVLADHGLTIEEKIADAVPDVSSALVLAGGHSGGFCDRRPPKNIVPRYEPALTRGPLTHASALSAGSSATATMSPAIEEARPAISLVAVHEGVTKSWKPVRDLLSSAPTAEEFVVELDNDETAYLRFGDDRFGRRPSPTTTFSAKYRVGNGTAGNVGASALAHVVTTAGGIREGGVTNLLAARGGTDPETPEEIRQRAPVAFRARQERAVTPADYEAKMKAAVPTVQRAAATLRWTGSWYTVFLTIDRLRGQRVDAAFEDLARRGIERYRMAGHDLEIDDPRDVPLEIELFICVKPDYFKSQVEQAVRERFSAQLLPDGSRGIFHADNLSFGQPVYLSPLYAAAQSVDGVASVEVRKFQRQGIDSDEAIRNGKLDLDRLEIARLDNDPNFPDRGVLRLTMRGGR